MGSAHSFITDEISGFIASLESRHYKSISLEDENQKMVRYSKTLSGALVKHYAYSDEGVGDTPVRIRVTYELIRSGQILGRLTRQLKVLNSRYRQSLPVWKTRPLVTPAQRARRFKDIQKFLREHGELINAFKYQADDRITEGNHSFNMEIASTPREQAVCVEFIKALVEAYAPEGIVRGRRQVDKPRQQRNGWIKRYADLHRKKGWTALEISKEIQRELREGTWDERSRLQYNLSNNTICKIAGIKIAPSTYN